MVKSYLQRRLPRATLAAGAPLPHQRRPRIGHHRAHVRKVHVHQARDLRSPSPAVSQAVGAVSQAVGAVSQALGALRWEP